MLFLTRVRVSSLVAAQMMSVNSPALILSANRFTAKEAVDPVPRPTRIPERMQVFTASVACKCSEPGCYRLLRSNSEIRWKESKEMHAECMWKQPRECRAIMIMIEEETESHIFTRLERSDSCAPT